VLAESIVGGFMFGEFIGIELVLRRTKGDALDDAGLL
jgi:hypothetical protein